MGKYVMLGLGLVGTIAMEMIPGNQFILAFISAFLVSYSIVWIITAPRKSK